VPFFGAGVITLCLDFSIVWNNAWLSALRLASFLLPNILPILALPSDISGNFSVSFIIDYLKLSNCYKIGRPFFGKPSTPKKVAETFPILPQSFYFRPSKIKYQLAEAQQKQQSKTQLQ
jgi:hypothetical protein